jgi:hypothetical protein
MKTLRICAMELNSKSPMEQDKFITSELQKAGFDMKKHIEKYLGAEKYEYLFTQEE